MPWKTNGNSSIEMGDGVTFFMEYPRQLYFPKPDGGVERRPMPKVKNRRAVTELIVRAVNAYLDLEGKP